MKSFLILLFIAFSSLTTFAQDDTGTMNGTYEGFENDKYVFTDDRGNSAKFTDVTDEVAAAYDLIGTKLVGRQFVITFIVEGDLDEYDSETAVSTIVDLIMPE